MALAFTLQAEISTTTFYTLFNKYQGKKSNISVPFALY